MATYLYCVLNEPSGVPQALAGIDGAPVRSIGTVGLAAWVSDVAAVPVTPTVERLKAHDTVCGAALDAGDTPLPVRFGRTFVDSGAVVEAIASRRQALGERLAHVAGCVELRVVASRESRESGAARSVFEEERPQDAPGGAAGPGTAFLRDRARRMRDERAPESWCEAVRRRVAEAAGGLIVEVQTCEARRGLAYLPLLVRRAEFNECRGRIAMNLPGFAHPLSLLGPFPPYSFVGDA